ncbi:hypothetical protein BFP72_13175 [Reichenbachiella sp. 5M10]|uniref:four helix bundle protein n=1 Tax=Reichenbachiella sp. 5M10 TaxID=1889772 RepID=UPI000C15BC83|nr:four helix bundle protein [Reichenbachiella sp. 5M10]PIB36275.1 hypothetical protein BFP72_13175 [Reichenbachiella sp. 5M10]
MKIERFEDILSWQTAKALTVEIYSLFGTQGAFGVKNQIERALVSIMNNIAEGFERRTNNEFRQFLFYAKGSPGEVGAMLLLGFELKKSIRQILTGFAFFHRKSLNHSVA